MTKQPKGGLPYLRISLKFNTSSTEQLSSDSKLEDFTNALEKQLSTVLIKPDGDPGPRGHEYKNDKVVIGLQPVFDEMSNETIVCALFDSESFFPSGVGKAISLYIINCSSSKCFAIPGLKKLLSSLGIMAEAIGFTSVANDILEFLNEEPLVPIGLANEMAKARDTPLVAPILTKSIGKNNKKNKKKKN